MAWLSGWDKRKKITLTGGASGAQNEYQMKLDVVYDSDMQPDFDDLRFTQANGETLLNAWLESKIDSTSAVIVVKTDTPVSGIDSDIYMYYGNSSVKNTWDIVETFVFGDDFECPWDKYKSKDNPLGEYPFMRVVKDGDSWHMYYMDFPNFNHATSLDGIHWTDDVANNPILEPSSTGWDNYSVWGLTPIKVGENDWHAVYSGRSWADIDALGHATSIDGVNWIKDTVNNPVVEATEPWEEYGPEVGSILQVGSTFYLWYHQTGGEHRDCGVATSIDWKNWTKDPANPIFPGTTGLFHHSFSPGIFEYNGIYYIVIAHYGEDRDYASFRLYEDSSPTFYSGSRIDRGWVISPTETWEDHDMDTFRVPPGVPVIDGEIYGYYVAEHGGTWQAGLVRIPITEFPVSTFTGFDKWVIEDGSWDIKSGRLFCPVGSSQGLIRTASYNTFEDNILEYNFKFISFGLSAREGALIRYQDTGNYYGMWLTQQTASGGVKAVAIENRVAGSWDNFEYVAQEFVENIEYEIAHQANNVTLKTYFSGDEKLSTTRNNFSSGAIGFRSWFSSMSIGDIRVSKHVIDPATYLFGTEEVIVGWLSGWSRRKKITLTGGASGAQTEYQVKLDILYDSDMQPDFDDLRFTQADGTTLIPAWLESKINLISVVLWVKTDTPADGVDADIYMYYGNSIVDSVWDIDDTFLFGDDFISSIGVIGYEKIFGKVSVEPQEKYSGNPILVKGSSGSWEDRGVRSQTLLVDQNGEIQQENGLYIMYYNGRSTSTNNTGIGRATFERSVDKFSILNMIKYPNNPVLDILDMGWPSGGVGVSSVIKRGTNDYIMYFCGGSAGEYAAIYYATSTDGISWTPNTTPILSVAGHNLAEGNVHRIQYGVNAGTFVLYVEYDADTIYHATSNDWTTGWAWDSGNPIITGADLSWAYDGACNPKFVELGEDEYLLGINGRISVSTTWRGGFMSSTSLDSGWTDYGKIVLNAGVSGSWDDARIESLELFKDDIGSDTVGMLYFGCPSTDSSLNCSIGYTTIDQNAFLVGEPGDKWTKVGAAFVVENEELKSEDVEGNIITVQQPYINSSSSEIIEFKTSGIIGEHTNSEEVCFGLGEDAGRCDDAEHFGIKVRYYNDDYFSVDYNGSWEVGGGYSFISGAEYLVRLTKTATTLYWDIFDAAGNNVKSESMSNAFTNDILKLYFHQRPIFMYKNVFWKYITVRQYATNPATYLVGIEEEEVPLEGYPIFQRWLGIPGMRYLGRNSW